MSLHSCSHRAGSLQGPCLQLQSQLRPPTAQKVPSFTREKRRYQERKKRWREGAFLAQKKGETVPWASTTHRHSLQLPFPISDLLCRQSWLIQTRTGSHLTPCSGFPKQTATGNSNEIQKGNCSYHCPTHTHVPSSPPHPILSGSKAEGLCCRAAPAQTHPHARQSCRCGTAEQHGPGSAAGEMSPG